MQAGECRPVRRSKGQRVDVVALGRIRQPNHNAAPAVVGHQILGAALRFLHRRRQGAASNGDSVLLGAVYIEVEAGGIVAVFTRHDISCVISFGIYGFTIPYHRQRACSINADAVMVIVHYRSRTDRQQAECHSQGQQHRCKFSGFHT